MGYAVVALDGDVTSWRFKQPQLPWPFVMITSPADRRPGSKKVSVRARDTRRFDKEYVDADWIEPAAVAPYFKPRPRPDGLGSPALSVGSWPIRGLSGDPQGPNRVGHKW